MRVYSLAVDAALAAAAVSEAAGVSLLHAHSREQEARESAEASGLLEPDIDMSAADWRRYNELEHAVERAIEKSELLERRDDAARVAAEAAHAEGDRCRIMYERMIDWVQRTRG